MLVPREKLAEAEELAAGAAEAFTPGDPFAEATTLGPLVSEVQRERVRGYIEQGIAEGAKLVTGGAEPPEGLDSGYFVRPTVFSEVTPEMTIAREEIFGPVLVIQPYDGVEDGGPDRQRQRLRPRRRRLVGRPRAGDRGRQADPHRPDRDQRRRLQPARPVRRLRPVRPRPRERALRARGVSPGEELAAVGRWRLDGVLAPTEGVRVPLDRRRSRRSQGEVDPGSGSARLEPDLAAVGFDDRAGDGEAEAGAVLAAGGVAAVEGLEDALAVAGRDPLAVVGDLDLDARRRRCGRGR